MLLDSRAKYIAKSKMLMLFNPRNDFFFFFLLIGLKGDSLSSFSVMSTLRKEKSERKFIRLTSRIQHYRSVIHQIYNTFFSSCCHCVSQSSFTVDDEERKREKQTEKQEKKKAKKRWIRRRGMNLSITSLLFRLMSSNYIQIYYIKIYIYSGKRQQNVQKNVFWNVYWIADGWTDSNYPRHHVSYIIHREMDSLFRLQCLSSCYLKNILTRF